MIISILTTISRKLNVEEMVIQSEIEFGISNSHDFFKEGYNIPNDFIYSNMVKKQKLKARCIFLCSILRFGNEYNYEE